MTYVSTRTSDSPSVAVLCADFSIAIGVRVIVDAARIITNRQSGLHSSGSVGNLATTTWIEQRASSCYNVFFIVAIRVSGMRSFLNSIGNLDIGSEQF